MPTAHPPVPSRLLLTAALLLPLPTLADITPRIVGGSDAADGAYPFAAAIIHADSASNFAGQFCGGSVIDTHWILTAAHCVRGESAGDLAVVAGTTVMSDTTTDGRLAVNAIVSHPAYLPATLANDIALLHLVSSTDATPVALDDGSTLSTLNLLDPVTAVGWGDTQADPRFPTALQDVVLEYIPRPDCDTDYYDNTLHASNFCAGIVDTGGKDTCSGDSGGPLLHDTGSNWLQIGITSFGDDAGCALAAYPGVYAATGHFADWIAAIRASTDLAAGLRIDGDKADNPLRLVATLENQSETTAADARLRLTAPASVAMKSPDRECTSDSDRQLTCHFNDLAAGTTRQARIVATFAGTGTFTLAARAVSATDDYDSTDDVASRDIRTQAPTLSFAGGDDGGAPAPRVVLLMLLATLRRAGRQRPVAAS